MPSPVTRRAPDRVAALAQYRRRADVYDKELAPFEPVRTDAIAALRLRPGETVLDVGCGTGLSLELLEQGIGSRGRIVGIEQSPDMIAKAQSRVLDHHWRNVELLCAPAATAPVAVQAHAALFHFTHDILRDRAAVGNVLAHLQPGARVVAAGLQWAPPWVWATNAFVMLAAMYSVTSFEGLNHPWDRLTAHLRDVEVETAMMGGIYIASGVYDPASH